MKILGIVLLSILLFILLSVFGFAFWVDQTTLNPGFIIGIINDIDFSETARDVMEDEDLEMDELPSPELTDAIIDTIDNMEPVLKENISTAIRDAYDYALGKSDAPSLQEILDNSFMNARFVDSVLQKINVSEIVREVIDEQQTSNEDSKELEELVLDSLEKLEPAIKQKIVIVSDPVFKYILGQTQTIDLKNILRHDVFDKEFMTEIINSVDIMTFARDLFDEQLEMALPEDIILTDEEIDRIFHSAEPSIKSGLISAADAIADYILGLRSSFDITIQWDSALSSAKPIVKEAFLRQLPPELDGATPLQIELAFEVYWLLAQSSIPTDFDFDSSMLGEDTISITSELDSMQEGLTDTRNAIEEANTSIGDELGEIRPYINIFRIVFWGLIGLILITIAGIILIDRTVKGFTLNLGITFTVYGAIYFTGVMVARSIIGKPAFIEKIMEGEIPDSAVNLISVVVQRLTQPIFIFTLICLVIGIILLIFYFVYPRIKPSATVDEPLLPST